MRPGFVARKAMRGIERYRQSDFHDLVGHGCRFTPTCSHYADDALRLRALPVALLLIVWRVLRCTPMTKHGTVDVVRRPRPGLGRRVAAILGLSAITTLIVAGTAAAVATQPQATQGGCQAYVGGQPINRLTRSDPLQVHKGQRIVLTGTGAGGGPSSRSITVAEVHFIEKVATKSFTEDATGVTFQKSVNVDTYLKYGSGLYRVDVRSVAPGAWTCSATFYMEMNGSKTIAEVAVAMGALGAAGMIGARRGGKPDLPSLPEAPDRSTMPDPSITPDELDARTPKPPVDKMVRRIDRVSNMGADMGMGCIGLLLFYIIGPVENFVEGVAVASRAGLPDRERVWVRGHPVLGFISGLFAGVGTTVALQQFGVYPLTVMSAIVAPLGVAVLGALRALRGTAWKVG